MIIVLSITLILIAITNILTLRRRDERLQIFSKIEVKNTSLLSLVESQLAEKNKSFFDEFSFGLKTWIQFNSRILMMGQSKVRTIVYIFVGTIAGLILNKSYIGYDNYIVIPFSAITTILLISFFKKRKLKKDFYENFPEALNVITGLVSSGYAVTSTFKSCGDSVGGIVGKTMKEVNDRLEVGDSVENVLMNSYLQLPFPEYYFFILTVMVFLDSGGELKEVFSRLGKMLTDNRLMTKTRDGKTAELRMTMWILGAMPFLFIGVLKFISIQNYEILINTNSGHYLLYYVFISVAIGFFIIKSWISKIV